MRVTDCIKGVRCALAAEGADAAQLLVGEVEAVHRDVRDPAGTLALADAGDEPLDQRGLARARATGYAEDGTAVFSQTDGLVGQSVKDVRIGSHAAS
jgi:hypothetical protein